MSTRNLAAPPAAASMDRETSHGGKIDEALGALLKRHRLTAEVQTSGSTDRRWSTSSATRRGGGW